MTSRVRPRSFFLSLCGSNLRIFRSLRGGISSGIGAIKRAISTVLIWFGAFGIAIAESAGTEFAVMAVSGFVMACGGLAAIYDTLVELEEELGVKLAILAVRGVIFFGGFGLISELSGGNAYLTAAMTVVILTAVFLYSAKDSEPPRGFAEADWF